VTGLKHHMNNKRHAMNFRLPALAAAAILAGFVPAHAQSVEEFYRGKSITLAIGFTPGGGYDLYARHLARHMGKHIPGNPTIVPQNMAGAGSLRAANFVYSAAPKDAARERRDLRRHQVHLARQRHQ
jgi:tripartite-type tricarboxylate transporter receptor subunit TctC